MSFSYKTFRILNKLATLDLSYETALENLASESYIDNAVNLHEKTNLKFILFKNFYFGSTQQSLYFIWQGLLLLKMSMKSDLEFRRKLLNQQKQISITSISDYSTIDPKGFLLKHHINNCIHQAINDGNGSIEIIYGIQRELEFLGLSFSEFFLGIRLQKWKSQQITLPLSSFFNETEEKIGNEKKPWTTSSSQLEILYTEQFTSTFPAYFSKNLIELKGISPINPFITVVINPLIIKTRQKKKIISTTKSFITYQSILMSKKWSKLIKNFLMTGYFVNYKTYNLVDKLDSNVNLPFITNFQISKKVNDKIRFSIPFYSKITYSQFNPVKLLNENLNCENLFQVLLIVQEMFSNDQIEQCFYKLTNFDKEIKIIEKNKSLDFLHVIITYFQVRYPSLIIEFLYTLFTLTVFEKDSQMSAPISLPLFRQRIKKTLLNKKPKPKLISIKNSSQYLWTQETGRKIKSSRSYSQKPKGIWNSITTYQQIRKQYVSVYQTLETYEEKIELEKAFANVVIELEHNIFQSLSDFFKKGYKVSNYRNAQRFSFLVEKELRLIDTDLEIFFLQKTLQKYLSNMV